MKRQLKLLSLSKGINKIEENKKIIPLSEQQKIFFSRRTKTTERTMLVQSRSLENFILLQEQKTKDLQKHERMIYFKVIIFLKKYFIEII